MDWIKNKLWDMNDIFEKFPSVFWLTMATLLVAVVAIIGYIPLLLKIANYEILTIKPFYSMIANNFTTLRWGLILVPALILLTGFSLAHDLYLKRVRRYY